MDTEWDAHVEEHGNEWKTLEIVIYTIVIIEEQLLSLFSLFRRKWELLENLPSCA